MLRMPYSAPRRGPASPRQCCCLHLEGRLKRKNKNSFGHAALSLTLGHYNKDLEVRSLHFALPSLLRKLL